MKIDDLFCIFGNGVGYVMSVVQTNEILQIVSFVLSTLTSVVIIAFRLWAWWKKAKEDGKISKEEIDEAIDILEDAKEKKDDEVQ